MERKRDLYASAKRSQHMIQQALLNLMETKDFHQITVSEIMKEADLVRRTFYAHYKTKEDILNAAIDRVIEESSLVFEQGVRTCQGNMPLVYFQLWCNQVQLVSVLKKNGLLSLLKRFDTYIVQLVSDHRVLDQANISARAAQYAPFFYTGAMLNLLEIWYDNGMEETPEQLSHLFGELFMVGQASDSQICNYNQQAPATA